MNHVEGPRTLQHVPQVIWHVIARRAARTQEFGAFQETGLPDFRRQFDCNQCVETPAAGRTGENDNRT